MTDQKLDHGTLLWIGGRHHREFRAAYEYCEARAAQIAYRPHMQSAIDRSARGVRLIVLCRQNDSSAAQYAMRKILRRHRTAQAVAIRGSLEIASGRRPYQNLNEPLLPEWTDLPTIEFHQWDVQLPQRLRRCGWEEKRAEPATSIAVIAANAMAQQTLLSVASLHQVPTAAFRSVQQAQLAGFDQIWWDESATAGKPWGSLLQSAPSATHRHTWITSDQSLDHHQLAKAAGVENIVIKPGSVARLLPNKLQRQAEPLEQATTNDRAWPASARQAA